MNKALALLHRWLMSRWLQLAGVLAMGIFLRGVQLAEIPNGYFHDEAWSDAKAMALVNGTVQPQVYFAENNGMDALPVYLIAVLFKFTGPLAIGSRIVSTLAGSLAILATYWAVSELFADSHRRHALGLIASFVMATLFWALTTSRSGWHVMSMTLIVTLSLAALVRGRRLQRRRWFVLSGILAGLAQYTYPSARFLAVLLLVLFLMDVWHWRARWRVMAADYASLAVAAAIVFAPLGYYFAQNPEWFFVRAQQVSKFDFAGLLQNVTKTLAGFSFVGDAEVLHNLPGRPALDPILSVFFVSGILVCIARRRFAHGLLLSWLIVFSLPVALTAPAPLFRRWVAVLPAEVSVIALGVTAMTQAIRSRIHAAKARSLVPLVITVALIASAGWSIAAYFGPYAANPQMFWAYDSGITQVANYIRGRSEAAILLTPYDRFYEVVAVTLAGARVQPIQSYNGMECVVFPEVTDRVTEWVVITEKDTQTIPAIQQIFPNHQIVWEIRSPVGVYARALQVPSGQSAQWSIAQRDRVNFANQIELLGFDPPQAVKAGKALHLTVALKATVPQERLYKVFIHVRGRGGSVLAQDDRFLCNFTLNEADWRPGDIVLQNFEVNIPADLAPGKYPVVLGLYQPDTGARLAVSEPALENKADSIELGQIEVK